VPWKGDRNSSQIVPMKVPRTYKAEAVVIKRTKLGEADRIVTLYTPDYGKIKAVTKGTRRPKSKLGGHVELLTYSSLLLAKGRNLDIVTQAQTIESFLPLKNDLHGMAYGLYVTELLDSFTIENDVNRELFDLLIDTLQRLVTASNKDIVLRYFELHLLDRIGYRPQLQCCTNCGKSLQPVTNYFSSSQGGALCRDCSYEEPVATPISLNALKVLRLWQGCTYDSAAKVNINAELSSELEQIMREYIRSLLERQVKSVAWLDTLKR
jgi:DNA repair protein RecO (recombination protein O)